jgi:16S rRNA C1402 (ribose-2'-O) methylase RsmI
VCAERSIQLLSARSKSLVTYETAERLENEIRDLLRNWNVDATIEDSITGNTTTTADLDDE